MRVLLFAFIFGSTSVFAKQRVEVEKIKVLHEREVAARGSFKLKKTPSLTDWKACIPQESVKFPTAFSQEQQEAIFSGKEFEDLKNCTPNECAFNFLPYEKEFLARLESDEDYKNAFYDFYANRVKGRTPLDPLRTPFFIRSSDEAFRYCSSSKLSDLLDNRPLKIGYRLALAQYGDKMRPTTRLVQGVHYKTEDIHCYAEALIFSNHYDLDRVDVWSLHKDRVVLEARDRIDFLRTWVRRLQKGKLQKVIEEVVERDLKAAQNCLSERL